MGVTIQDMNEDLKSFYNRDSGAIVTSVVKDSPAEKSGLKRGDLIIAVDGKSIKDSSELKNFIGSLAPDKSTKLTFIRDGKEQDDVSGEFSYQGIKFNNIDDAIRQKLQMPPNMKGVIVMDAGTSEGENGLQAGDIVLQVESETIKSVAELKAALAKYAKQPKKRFYVNRHGLNLMVVAP